MHFSVLNKYFTNAPKALIFYLVSLFPKYFPNILFTPKLASRIAGNKIGVR